jgi:hypothetical protein
MRADEDTPFPVCFQCVHLVRERVIIQHYVYRQCVRLRNAGPYRRRQVGNLKSISCTMVLSTACETFCSIRKCTGGVAVGLRSSRVALRARCVIVRPSLWTGLVLRGWQRDLPTAWSLWLKSGGVSVCCTVAEVGLDSGLGVIPLSRCCCRDPHTSSASRWRIKRIKTFDSHQIHCWCCQCAVIKINVQSS